MSKTHSSLTDAEEQSIRHEIQTATTTHLVSLISRAAVDGSENMASVIKYVSYAEACLELNRRIPVPTKGQA